MTYFDYLMSSNAFVAQREREVNGVISVAGGAIIAVITAKTFMEFLTVFILTTGIMFSFNEAISNMIYFIKTRKNNQAVSAE